jgi:hypothetical protein
MPRRNHNAGRPAPDVDRLTTGLDHLAAILTVADGTYPCAGYRKRGHWNGDYCPLCKGALILSARTRTLIRR